MDEQFDCYIEKHLEDPSLKIWFLLLALLLINESFDELSEQISVRDQLSN